jgi:sn-glycerol 3-phosphate transport system permease protein
MPVNEFRRQRRLRLIVRYLLLSLAGIVVMFPLYMAIVNSLLVPTQLTHQPPPLFPTDPQWHTYSDALTKGHLGIYLRNSAIQTSIIVLGQVLTSVLAAYAFAFLEFPFKRTIFALFLATLMVPFEVTVATNLMTISSLGWFNTFQGLCVPFLATGFGIFLLRQAFMQIPRDLREAAELDGYGHLRFLWRVALPLTRPVVAALGVFSFLTAWNQYLWPLLISGNNDNVRTVQIGLKQLLNTQLDQINISLAGSVIAVLPLLILLVVFQKQLVRSLTAGAVK